MADTGLAKKMGGALRAATRWLTFKRSPSRERLPPWRVFLDRRLPEILNHHQVGFESINLRPGHGATVSSDGKARIVSADSFSIAPIGVILRD